jgi:multidrug resistance protein, MATE family
MFLSAQSVSQGRAAPWRDEVRATIALGLPLALSQVAQIAIQTTDVVMMGWLGPESLAAGGLAANLFVTQLIFGMGILTAVSPIAAQILGAPGRRGKVRGVGRTVYQGLWMATLLSVPFMIVCWYVRPLLIALGQDPQLAALAEPYMHGLLWAMPPVLWFIVLRGFVSALSRPRAVFLVTLWGVLFNALAVYALMFGKFGFPALGLPGAGIASACVYASMAVVLFAYAWMDRRFRPYLRLGGPAWPEWVAIREIARVGTPIGFMWVAEGGVFSVAMLLMGLLGATEIAAHQIALQCAAIAFMVPLGMSQAATVRVGLAAGAGDAAGVRRAGWTAVALGTAFMAFTCLLFLFGGRAVVGLFLDPGESATRPAAILAAKLLVIAGVFQLFDGAQSTAAGALRGLKDTRVPLAIAIFGYWIVAFPLAIALGFAFRGGAVGIWIGLAAGLAVAAALLSLRFRWASTAFARSAA